jgi:flagellar biosynthetic protein FliR
MLMFLTLNIHHWFFRAMAESFRRLPPLSCTYTPAVSAHVMEAAGQMFVVAIQVGAPVIVVLVLTSVAFGLVARTVPQMNVFVVAMPLKVVIGLLFVSFSLPFLAGYLGGLFGRMGTSLAIVLRAVGG